jgi:hypothetical protein
MKCTGIFSLSALFMYSSVQAAGPELPLPTSSSNPWISNIAAPIELKAKWVQEWREAINAKPPDERKISILAAEISTFTENTIKGSAAVRYKVSVNQKTIPQGSPKTASGEALAAKLNVRFNRVVPDCDGKAAYRCSGVVLRSNETSGASPTWVPGAASARKEILPTSYIRRDISNAARSIWSYRAAGFGILLYAADEAAYSARCIFPINGYSNVNADNGCGVIEALFRSDIDNSNCAALGVTTAAQWMEKTPGALPYCSFSTHSAGSFLEAIKTQNLYHEERHPAEWNELVVNASPGNWDAGNPANNPIEALWYHKKALESDQFLVGRPGAQQEQLLIFEMTGKGIPIISIDDTKPDAPFGYAAEDQLVWSPDGTDAGR